MTAIAYDNPPLEEIHQIRPLWDELRIYTRDINTHFKSYYENLDFEERIQKFSQPGVRANIDVAIDRASGRIVGYALASVDAEQMGELDSFYVLEEFRRMGIGDELLTRAIAWMKRQKPRQMMILTAVQNREVLALYARHGFYPRLIMLNHE